MFLFAETPHAYLDGVALEIMANSDNVLPAGLTNKYIDTPELMSNVVFKPKLAPQWLTEPVLDGQIRHFPIPVDDVAFFVYPLEKTDNVLPAGRVSILFYIEGSVELHCGKQTMVLTSGESVFPYTEW